MASKNIESFPGQVEVTSDLTVDTNTLHVDSVSGRVGMGKTNPGYVMDVNGTVNATALYVNGSEFTGGGGGGGGESVWTATGSGMYYTTGNVGIGLTNPVEKLHLTTGGIRITDGGTNVVDLDFADAIPQYSSYLYNSTYYFGLWIDRTPDDSYLIVGVRGDSTVASYAGAAYIYVRSGSTWSYQTKLTAPDGGPNHWLGWKVAISSDGSYALAGAQRGEANGVAYAGAAYVYVRDGSTWTYQAKFTHPNPTPTNQFVESVAISGDGTWVMLGSNRYNSFKGSVSAFHRTQSSWSYVAELKNPTIHTSNWFGEAVAISQDGSYAAVGARAWSAWKGTVYTYTRTGTTWNPQTSLQPITPYALLPNYSAMGQSLSISSDGSYIIAGAFTDNNAGPNTGAAHIYARTGSVWSHQEKVIPPDAAQGDAFGWTVSISLDGTLACVGANRDDDNGFDSGSAYYYTRSGSTWNYKNKFIAPNGTAYKRFGNTVKVTNNMVQVGTYSDRYVYEFLPQSPLEVSTPIIANGTTLSFTGQHICFPEGSMEKGLVVSANKNKYMNLNGPLTTGSDAIRSSEALPVISLSNVANDRTVFGVVDHFEQIGTTRTQKSGATITQQDKETGDNRVVVNSLGEGAIWVVNTNGNVASGDLLTTSHLPGYAQRQDDDILTNYTVAKSTMDCDFDPQELPNQVILKDVDGNNVLDSYGRLQWVDDPEGVTTLNYITRYLDVSGTPTDEANAVYTAAFVGCTYHCG